MTHHTKPMLRLISNLQAADLSTDVTRYDRPAHLAPNFARVNRQHDKPTRAELWFTRAAWALILLSIIAVAGIALSAGMAIANDAIAHPYLEGFE